MRFLRARVCIFLMGLCFFCYGTREGRSQIIGSGPRSLVNFQTEDGWTIHGTLFLPETFPANRVPGVVLVGQPGGGMTTASTTGTGTTAELQNLGMASLIIEVRGHGRSLGKKESANFSPKDLDGFQLDIRDAIKFLASQKNVDSRRIGIIAGGIAANYAVLEASEHPEAVQALVVSGPLGAAARDYIKFQERLPIYFLADVKDKASFREMANAYSESKNVDSVFALSASRMSAQNPAGPERWLFRNLSGLGVESEVSFQTTDGWTIRGRLHIPPGADKRTPVAGVVLVHGAQHDQKTYYDLARDLVKGGLVVLTYDWRGKGESADDDKWYRGKVKAPDDPQWVKIYGKGVDPQNTKLYLDVQAAIEFLATREVVDPARIGLLGATWGTDHVLKAAIGDARIKTIVLLSPGGGGGVPETEMTQYLTTSDVPILSFTSEDDTYGDGLTEGWVGAKTDLEVARKVYFLSKSKYSQLVVYSHGAHGSGIFDIQPEVRPTIVRWFTEKLDKSWLKGVSSSK